MEMKKQGIKTPNDTKLWEGAHDGEASYVAKMCFHF